jgi:hypothetical protein
MRSGADQEGLCVEKAALEPTTSTPSRRRQPTMGCASLVGIIHWVSCVVEAGD